MTEVIRPAVPGDAPEIHELIRGLADYSGELDGFTTSVDDVRRSLADGLDNGLVVEGEGRLDGVALWFERWSTWEGGHTMWLEDLIVRPEARGRKLGARLLAALARVGVDKRYLRMEWTVFKCNEPSIGFYRGLGAEVTEPIRHTMRLDAARLRELAG